MPERIPGLERRLATVEKRLDSIEESRAAQHAENQQVLGQLTGKVNVLLGLLAANGGLVFVFLVAH